MSATPTYDVLSDPGAKALLAAFPTDSLRLVGGAVRNTLMGEPVADIDLATTLTPDAVIDTLTTADIKHVPTGIDHGTITAIIDKIPYEITSLRRDVATDGRRAVVAYTTDWVEDAQRRDFTYNALYLDVAGQVFDPTGHGVDDLSARRLRFVGDADARVREDYLRILRFFRFMAWYSGPAKVDGPSLKACRDNQSGLKSLSAERVWAELKRLLSAPDPTRAVTVMGQQGILETLLPEASNTDGLKAYVRLESRESLPIDPLLRLMAMSARLPLPILTLTRRLKLSKAEAKRLSAWAGSDSNIAHLIDPVTPDRDRLKAIYEEGRQTIMDRATLRAAGEEDAMTSARFMSLVDLAMGWTPPQFPISGKDLQAAGFAPGEQMGKILKALEALWVRSGFTVEKPQLLAAAKMMSGRS